MHNIKFVIWGAGIRGRRLFFHIGKENMVAFVDSNKSMEGSMIEGIQIISDDTFFEKYSDCCVLVSTHEEEIVPLLHRKNIQNYYCLSKCPEDFISSNPRNILKEHIKKNWDENKSYVIYGNSLFSILLFSWLYECNKTKNGFLVMGEGCCPNMIEKLKLEWGDCVRVSLEELEDKVEQVYVTTEDDLITRKKNKILNIYKYSELFAVYENKQLTKFKNIHEGKRCFIVATGPSLKREDLDAIKKNGEVCIGVNSIYKIFDQTKWRPDYYITADYRCMRDEEFALEFLTNKTCFIADNYESFNKKEHTNNVYIYHTGQFSNKFKNLPFSEDISKIIYAGGTVVYSAIQLAVYMGFKEIYLLGTDASGINGRYEKYGHFYEEETLESICFGVQVHLAYCTAKKYAEEHGVKIINASRGGYLEVFERVNFDHLLSF